MQNLTARYNYIYNSNVILTTHQQELAESFRENYDEILPVYIGPEIDSNFMVKDGAAGKSMDNIIKKAQTIILEKNNSNYLDDAYNLLGKAQFYKGNYFNAAEYFDYTTINYKKSTKSYIEALNWKARSLMQVRRLSEAKIVLDTLAYAIAGLKKNTSEPLATLAQMSIYQHKNADAILYLKDAIKESHDSQHRIRWTYILAQLSEQQKNYKDALLSYRKVEKSNAPFEMYFNANLNRIKLNALRSTKKTNRQDELLALLKDDKNTDYNDQVYYQIAESLSADGDYNNAIKNYRKSIQKSTKNQYQKGLSYLRIADLNFKQLHNYLNAKLYYDSAVNTLPKSYPGYDIILKKNQNLEYLTSRYQIIAKEDTLQAIARLSEQDRQAKIQAILNPVTDKPVIADQNNIGINTPGTLDAGNKKTPTSSTYYFNNAGALSTGYSDFKKKWGNRKLENNWRQSIRSSAQSTIQDITNNINTPVVVDQGQNILASADQNAEIKAYADALPTTPQLLAISNQKIIDAYYDNANFYLQELNDPEEAAEVYQILLARFPANNHLSATYYSLFLISKNKDEAAANNYRNKILTEYPNSVYAKTIIDPSFSIKQSELETAINKQYNDIFEQYQKKDFNGVIQRVDEAQKTNGENYLSPQYAYLKAIAIGRTNPLDPLLTAFNTITTTFPDDRLITPLAKDHIAYINAHLADFQKRKIALPDFDPNESPFKIAQVSAPIAVPAPIQTSLPAPQSEAPETVKPAEKPVTPIAVNTEKPVTPVPAKIESIFSTATSTVYYYVVDVADAALTLSSSRFGIGQFNRGNYAGFNLKHQLKEFDNDQLIYVGNFSNFDDAKTYATGITPQLKQIMKVPANIYSSFIISKENFDRLTSKDLLNKYLDFYKNNY
ncbi:MAG: gliding motility protein [Candidatus Pedobacter colombiensis]|uniref:Gliding motility protein n=1 Tax=Candidatus Pedobacter colombiensis TaxID=3121371 RepID=A0AAJ6B6Y5_9SPHI|nr:tetratricopeptide repeat protein [Pedobacter sp.]WEK18961.1 MAG: gliding motility protein [Pedobacter sp.]